MVEGVDFGLLTEADMAMIRLGVSGGGVEDTDFREFYIDDEDE